MKCVQCKNIAVPNKQKCKICAKEHAQRSQQRFQKLKKLGICTSCAKNKVYKNKLKCKECLNKDKVHISQVRLRRKQNNLCIVYGIKIDGTSTIHCEQHRIIAKNRSKYNRDKNHSLGLCRCGQDLYGGTKCFKCYFKDCCMRATGHNKLWLQLYDKLVKQKFRCIYTNRKLIPVQNMSVDHITPTTKGGLNNINNLQWIDTQINTMKNNRTHVEFIEEIESILRNVKK